MYPKFFRKVKNKLFIQFEKYINGINYIDVNASIDLSSKIKSSQLHGNIHIAERCTIFQTTLSGNISIGSNTTIWGPNIQILGINNPITIGSFCSIARDVSVQEYYHNYKKTTTYYIGRNIFGNDIENEVLSKGPIIIGNDVWIGTGVQIMTGVTIGDGAVIGANSTVTHNVPPYSIAGGVPAKVIKYRFSQEIIDELLRIKWWNWEIEKIKKNKHLFTTDLTIEMIKQYEQ
jgi:virginiamycin A acetyltransferase